MINNEVVSEQTNILIELISQHYQYYYQQSIELHAQDKTLPLEFYQDFINNFNVELEHINFDFPITANIGCDVEPEQVLRWALYWQLEFHPQVDAHCSFACTIRLITTNQQSSDFKLICEISS